MLILNEKLQVLYQDSLLVIIRKPPGYHVHPSELSPGETAVLQILRDQIDHYVYPAHRLDRPTSGVLVFALNAQTASNLGEAFRLHRVRKLYAALVRGWFPRDLVADSSLDDGDGVERPSLTVFNCLQHFELPMALGTFPTVRSSLVLCETKSGRRHQIRRHLSRSQHPVLGDTAYGDRHHNHFYQRQFSMPHLQLFSIGIGFYYFVNGEWLTVLDETVIAAGGVLEELLPYRTAEFAVLPRCISELPNVV